MKNIAEIISNSLGLTEGTMPMLSFVLSLITLLPIVHYTMKFIPNI